MKQVSDDIKLADERVAALDESLREYMLTVPNVPHSSVPVGAGAADNVEVRRWGAPPKFEFAARPHWEVGEATGILDLPAAVKMSGARFALYRGLGARLERSIAAFMLDTHTREHGYTEILPPFIVNSASLVADGKLPKFAADMFHLEGTDLWLTSTAETELTNLHRDETLDGDALPESVCAWTACFRSEAGSSGSINSRKSSCSNSRGRSRATTSWNRWWGMRRRFCRSLVCTIASCCFARAIWDSRRRRRTTSRCGCRRRMSLWRFRRARIAKLFRRGAREFGTR
jgi:hypothetical protein